MTGTTADTSADRFVERLEALRSPEELEKRQRYFKSGAGQYGEGDVFMGVRMGQVFDLAKEFIRMPAGEIEQLLESPVHEVRAGGVSIMDKQARRRRTPEDRRRALFELYLRRHDRINNWDLVDLGAPYVVGGYLSDFDAHVTSCTSWRARPASGSAAPRSWRPRTSSGRATWTTPSGSPRSSWTTTRT